MPTLAPPIVSRRDVLAHACVAVGAHENGHVGLSCTYHDGRNYCFIGEVLRRLGVSNSALLAFGGATIRSLVMGDKLPDFDFDLDAVDCLALLQLKQDDPLNTWGVAFDAANAGDVCLATPDSHLALSGQVVTHREDGVQVFTHVRTHAAPSTTDAAGWLARRQLRQVVSASPFVNTSLAIRGDVLNGARRLRGVW